VSVSFPVLAGPAVGNSYPAPPGGMGAIRIPRPTRADWVVDLYLLRRALVRDGKGYPVAVVEGWVPDWWSYDRPPPGLEIRQL
jgi:hypothetical protein